MLPSGTYHTRRTGEGMILNQDETKEIWTYWLEITQGEQRGQFITIQTYAPLDLKPLQEVAITIE